MTVKLKINTKWTLKMSQLGMVSSFHPHSMCKRVESVTAKTGRTSCTNGTISFEVSGFLTRTHLLHGHFIFLNLLQLQTFLRSVHTIQSDVINFQHVLTSFAVFQSFTVFVYRAKLPWNWKSLQNELWKCWNLAWYHHYTRIACAKE